VRALPEHRSLGRTGRLAFAMVALMVLTTSVAGCLFQSQTGVGGWPKVRCGDFEGPDCNDLLELGMDAVAGARPEAPLVVAVGGACPDNARCKPSSLGGEEVAVVVRWPDGTIDWATIPLPADWPSSAPGAAVAQDGPPPEHVQALLDAGD
jgi:hypothetical protein